VPKINVSFKETYEELYLYNEVLKQRDKSAFIKDAIEFYLKQKNTSVNTEDKICP
jgi:maltoporin